MNIKQLPVKNLKRRSGRTASLLSIIAVLAFTMLGGAMVLTSLRTGLNSLRTRLGADIIVVPDEAKSKKDLESILLDGVPGYFYMDRSYLDKVSAREGIKRITVQYYLASAKAGCCTMPVQIIGYDPDTDFIITPWIADSSSTSPRLNEIVVGYDVNASVGNTLTFFGVTSKVVAKLDRTGSALDTAVYANYDTIKLMIEGSKTNSFPYFSEHDPDEIISSILIEVEDGYSIEQVTGDINVHIRGVEAVATTSMLSGVADSLSAVSSVTGFLIAIVWILVIFVLVILFYSGMNERKKEFAVLRVMGTSRRMLSRIILEETFLLSLGGGVTGAVLALIVVIPFAGTLENKLNLPFLIPSVSSVALLFAGTILLTVAVVTLSASYNAYSLSRVDVGKILRE
ncbi:MAG: ABC transporter permease [Clostridiales bacterium]|nr:ABC transporter permease [Clostridiales bacterium]